MKASFTLTLVTAMLALGALAASGGAASAQTGPEANRGSETAPAQRAQPAERLPGPQRSEDQAPREEGPSAREPAPPMPGCQDQGRKLELIV
jgi:hypothetical protein